MDAPTYIADALTLVNNIHFVKQWIYNGSIRILIPTCVIPQVEERYHVSIAPKDISKEQHARKSFGKAPRKEQPLFDINPRTAWEFLGRARHEKGIAGVTFQLGEERFTQWEQATEVTAKVESPSAAPTSFANAVLRKLSIANGLEENGEKGPAKPKLVARSGEPKSPWKYHKVPTIPASRIPPNLKQLLSCILWRLHEFEKNSLKPESYILLVDEPDTVTAAKSLGIPVQTSCELRSLLLERSIHLDLRSEIGLLEIDFPERLNGVGCANGQGCEISTPLPANGNGTLNGLIVHADTATATEQGQNVLGEVLRSNGDMPLSQSQKTPPPGFESANRPVGSIKSVLAPEKHSTMAPIGTGRPKAAKEAQFPSHHELLSETTTSLLDTLTQGSTIDDAPVPHVAEPTRPLESPVRMSGRMIPENVESDMDSDEEVIVFNPKARRISGRQKIPPTSRPTTANGQLQDYSEGLKPAKSPIISTLKPQSPVFTPGQVYSPVTSGAIEEMKTMSQEHAVNKSPKQPESPARSPRPRSSTPRRPRAELPQRLPGNDQLQRQSEMIIKRQREAIQRQVKAAAKPPPRQIQLEPTENPTVIDPNAFDRSYVVQQPANDPVVSNGKHRSSGRGRRSPKGSPKGPPGQVADRSTAEPDVDFVLKSGTPRASVRGKGKLWVP